LHLAIDLGGRRRKLQLDLNALAAIELLTGRPLSQMNMSELTLAQLRGFLHACLKAGDPELTEEELGRWLLPSQLPEVAQCLLLLLSAYGDQQPQPPWAPAAEAVFAALEPRLPSLLDLSPGAGLLAARFAAAGKPAATYRGPALAGVETLSGWAEARRRALQWGAAFLSQPSLLLGPEEVRGLLSDGVVLYSVGLPAVEEAEGLASASEPVEGAPGLLLYRQSAEGSTLAAA
jgi:hypothetical protein